jgi:hypothetical protein
LPCICFVAAAAAAALDMVFVPLAFFKCVVDDTRLLLSGCVGDDGPSSQHTRLLQVAPRAPAAHFRACDALRSTRATSTTTTVCRSSGLCWLCECGRRSCSLSPVSRAAKVRSP